jgi:hypothetical protein
VLRLDLTGRDEPPNSSSGSASPPSLCLVGLAYTPPITYSSSAHAHGMRPLTSWPQEIPFDDDQWTKSFPTAYARRRGRVASTGTASMQLATIPPSKQRLSVTLSKHGHGFMTCIRALPSARYLSLLSPSFFPISFSGPPRLTSPSVRLNGPPSTRHVLTSLGRR